MLRPPKKKKLLKSVSAISKRRGRHSQEWYPLDVREERGNEVFLAKAVLKKRKANVTGAEEHNRGRQPDLKGVDVVTVHRQLPAKKNVIDHTDSDRRRDTVVRAHV